jgi:hypothetical protein
MQLWGKVFQPPSDIDTDALFKTVMITCECDVFFARALV